MMELGWLAVGVPVAIAGKLRRAKQSQQHEEEEKLTAYHLPDNPMAAHRDPAGPNAAAASSAGANAAGARPRSTVPNREPPVAEWEYKIVRAKWDAFRDPAIFEQLCIEEAQAGWTLLEKLDNRRVRFTRSRTVRILIKSADLSFDPYRTEYRQTLTVARLGVAIAFIVATIFPALGGYALMSQHLNRPAPPTQAQAATPGDR